MTEGTDEFARKAARPDGSALAVFAVITLVFAAIGLAQCLLWAFGILSPWLPDRLWLWVTLHGLEWWAVGVGALGPFVAGISAVSGGIIAIVGRLVGRREGRALLAVVLGLTGIAVFAAAWVATSMWVPGV